MTEQLPQFEEANIAVMPRERVVAVNGEGFEVEAVATEPFIAMNWQGGQGMMQAEDGAEPGVWRDEREARRFFELWCVEKKAALAREAEERRIAAAKEVGAYRAHMARPEVKLQITNQTVIDAAEKWLIEKGVLSDEFGAMRDKLRAEVGKKEGGQ